MITNTVNGSEFVKVANALMFGQVEMDKEFYYLVFRGVEILKSPVVDGMKKDIPGLSFEALGMGVKIRK